MIYPLDVLDTISFAPQRIEGVTQHRHDGDIVAKKNPHASFYAENTLAGHTGDCYYTDLCCLGRPTVGRPQIGGSAYRPARSRKMQCRLSSEVSKIWQI